MTKYKQLGQEQRYVIGRLLKAGSTQEEVSTAVGCHKSTISRELKRNIPKRGIGAKLHKPDKAGDSAHTDHFFR
jgi:IS30 family transposase